MFAISIFYASLIPIFYCLPLTNQLNESPSIHAVLVAGTSGWANYRHQANIAHGYQVLTNHGVDPKNIIVMMVNDVVNDEKNPSKGKLFNTPQGPNVYQNLVIDYFGNQVSAVNFLNILKGSESNSTGKVLNSGPNDSLLIYISSYGASGLIAFPNDILTSESLNQALVQLYSDHKYGLAMVVLDTGDSAFMFDSLPNNINIYSISSTSSNQQDFACFCDNSKFPFTCLGTSYSVDWLNDAGSRANLMDQTLTSQFVSIIKSLAVSSTPINPKQFGTQIFGDLSVGRFMGSQKSDSIETHVTIDNQLASFDVPLEMSRREFLSTGNSESYDVIRNSRNSIDRAFYRLMSDTCAAGYCSNPVTILNNQTITINDHNLYHKIITMFNSDCLNLGQNTYLLSKMYIFANVLSESRDKIASNIDKFSASLYQACRRRLIGHGYNFVV